MKIVFDTDGTVTDFNSFIRKEAIPYFEKNYNMKVIYEDKLEVEDIMDMENFFMKEKNVTKEEAKKLTKKCLDKFWISHRFVKFSLLDRFRPGVKKYINQAIKDGHEIKIVTSRAKTSKKDFIGLIARNFTILQYKFNGVKVSAKDFTFCKDDAEKIEKIKNINPEIAFDDKEFMINGLNDIGVKTITVKGNHNNCIKETENNKVIDSFDTTIINSKLEKLIGSRKLQYLNRTAIAKRFFDKKLKLIKPAVDSLFKPIVLNENNLINTTDEGILIAPNHVKTVDPFVLNSAINYRIHWVALKRFFSATDSIFNNNKNNKLCSITSNVLKKMECIPIERKCDNPNANNTESLKDIVGFLNINSAVAIFPEGTTRKEAGKDFGEFDSTFLKIAKKTDSWVQPVNTYWIKDDKVKSKVIINFGKAFKIDNLSINEAYLKYLSIQQQLLNENKIKYEELKNKSKTLQK